MREEGLRELVLEVLEEFKDKIYKCSDVSECLDELVRELDEEIKRATNGYCFIEAYDDCGVAIACGLLETLYVTLDCNELGPMLVRIYVDFIEYVRVIDARVE
jgi:hypothetical protein